jgi:hypothetical protein
MVVGVSRAVGRFPVGVVNALARVARVLGGVGIRLMGKFGRSVAIFLGALGGFRFTVIGAPLAAVLNRVDRVLDWLPLSLQLIEAFKGMLCGLSAALMTGACVSPVRVVSVRGLRFITV